MTAINSIVPPRTADSTGKPVISERELAAILKAVELLTPNGQTATGIGPSSGNEDSPGGVAEEANGENSPAAMREAHRHWQANLAALATSQPELPEALGAIPALQWRYGRDGSLTARDASGAWLDGCSLPHRAAGAMLRVLEVRGSAACYVAPTHAAQVRVALDKMKDAQAIIVLLATLESVGQQLCCCDFSQEIARHRLYFAAGERWPDMARSIFARHRGLATPTQFIRTVATAEDVAQAMMPTAEKIFAEVHQERAHQITQKLAEGNGRSSPTDDVRLLLIAPSHFRTWDNAGELLARWMAKWTQSLRSSPPRSAGQRPDADASLRRADRRFVISRLDTDDPACASSLALMEAAVNCDAIVAVDVGRGDLPAVLPAGVALISWMTTPRIPKYVVGSGQKNAREVDAPAQRDALLLADPAWKAAAEAAGWPRQRLASATWPAIELAAPSAQPPHLSLIADTNSLEAPEELERSSHRLLWEIIAGELVRDPLAIGGDPRTYLNRHMASAGISPEGFNWIIFGQRLLIPAYVQGLARVLAESGLPLRIYGRGWETTEKRGGIKITAAWVAPIDHLEMLTASLAAAHVVIHPWPTAHRSIFDALPRHILRPSCRGSGTVQLYLREAKRLLETPCAKISESRETISLDAIVRMC